jgi:uncharacterized RDD family membrane protein YckC
MEQHYTETTDLFLEEPVIYGGFGERFGAIFLDGLILLIPNYALTYLLPDVSGTLLSILMYWLYSALQESGPAQATLGKKALGLKVTSTAGERISFGQATGRHFGQILSALLLFVGYFMMLWNNERQTLHDKMADTLVVKS